jgi:hypothetical protein
MAQFLVPITETNCGSIRCETLEEAQSIQSKDVELWLHRVHWHYSSTTVCDIEDTEAPECAEAEQLESQQPIPFPPELLLVLISEILWPPECPGQPWDVEMTRRIANLLLLHRPEMSPAQLGAVHALMEEPCG